MNLFTWARLEWYDWRMTIEEIATLLDQKLQPIVDRLPHVEQDIGTIKTDIGQLTKNVAAIERRLTPLEEVTASKTKMISKEMIALKHELRSFYSWLGDDYDLLSIKERLERIEKHLGLPTSQ